MTATHLQQNTTTISAIVPAAGCGARANLNGNKVLYPLHGRPLLWWTLRALSHPAAFPPNTQLQEIIIAARPDEFAQIEEVLAELPLDNATQSTLMMRCVAGGENRQQSVQQAARAAQGDLLMVHDAARPLVSPQVLWRVIEAAQQQGAAIAALPTSDTVKQAQDSAQSTLAPAIAQTLDRRLIWLAQTPQIFRRKVLLSALDKAEEDDFIGTDCASLVERLCDAGGKTLQPVALIEGEISNFKVTYSSDVERAEALLAHLYPA
jgi:2-C-methyl-D-erythritol 4-phosphate cytidylyltransferase